MVSVFLRQITDRLTASKVFSKGTALFFCDGRVLGLGVICLVLVVMLPSDNEDNMGSGWRGIIKHT